MDIPRTNPYVSCIKIRGVPIIAPLMTDDLRAEMKYYKHLAMAVEERLKNLEAAADSVSRSSVIVPDDEISTTEESSTCEPESDSLEKTDRATEAIGDSPTKEVSIVEQSIGTSDNPDSSAMETAREAISCKSFSGEESSFRNDSSDMVTASTDINGYLNKTEELEQAALALDDVCQFRKPEVPKTLDIVPITLDATSPMEKPTSSQEMHSLDDTSKSRSSPDSDETPKLVRQGSYVLETPSPMLLAHLQEEMVDYVPTNSATKRREWNLTEAKSEWELRRKKENIASAITSRSTGIDRTRRNSASNVTNQKMNRWATPSRTGKYLSDSKQVARSADCIQSIMNDEHTLKTSKSIRKINVKSENCKPKTNGVGNRTNTKDTSISNLANKLSGSLGSLSNPGIRCGKRTPKKTPGNRLSKSFDSGEKLETVRSSSVRGSTQKLLSMVTSEKLVHVFEEIQTTHELQMKELIERQCQEQRIMQREFEKQQRLLLAQIEQTFPGISLRRFVEKVSPLVQCSIENHENSPKLVRSTTEILSNSRMTNGSHDNENNENVKCPLDGIYPREVEESLAHGAKPDHSTCDNVVEQKSPPIGLYSTYVLNGERRNSTVSRQLFPLDGKTRHVPVPNRSIYQEQHVKAATIITAYARGYLVRRLLRTDRVIDLKITYKEALHCMLKLHVDAPLALPELNFHQRLQLQCDAASMNIVELFAQAPAKRMEIIRQDREIKKARQERPNSARSYSFATQRTLARKKLKEMGYFETNSGSRTTTLRSRCQTWATNAREKRSPYLLNQGIKRSTSAGAVRKPWR